MFHNPFTDPSLNPSADPLTDPSADPSAHPFADPFAEVVVPKLRCIRCRAVCDTFKCDCGTYSVFSVRRTRRKIKGR